MEGYVLKRHILCKALECRFEGMKAENFTRMMEDKASAYTDEDFYKIENEFQTLAYKHDEQL